MFSIALEEDLLWTGFPQDPENWASTVVGGEDFDGDGGADVVMDNFSGDGSGYDMDVYFSGVWDDILPPREGYGGPRGGTSSGVEGASIR